MLTSRCSKCRKKIPYGEHLCKACSLEKGKKNREHIKKYNQKLEESDKLLKTQAWRKTRRLIIDRDKFCVLCAKKNIIETRNLQVHHIQKRVDAPDLVYDPLNLITLCKKCHEEVEEMSVKDQKELFKDSLKNIDYWL